MMSACTDPNGLENCYLRGKPIGFETLSLASETARRTMIMVRILQHTVPSLCWRGFNRRLLKVTSSAQPDVVWIFKGMEVFPATLRALRARGITLVNYNADHPYLHFFRGSGNGNVRKGIPEYHLHLTYSHRIARELHERFRGLRVTVVPFGHEVSDEVFASIDGEDEIRRVCFLGNPDAHRALNVRRLLEAGLAVDLYGYRWDRFLNPHPMLRISDQATGMDMLRTLRRYRVQLNFFRPHNVDSHNMRSFEVPACGGIMLGEDSIEHRHFFEHGREAFFFGSAEEMIGLARHLLALPENEAYSIRRAARRRSVTGGYSYRDRAKAAFEAIRNAHMQRCEKRESMVRQ
jgi:hypothetical protein